MSRATSRGLRAILYVTASAALLIALWHWLDGPDVMRRLRYANSAWLTFAFMLLSLQLILSALRWQLTSRQLNVLIPISAAIRQYYLSMLCNLTLPGGIAGDAGRAWHHRDQAGVGPSAAAVILERTAGQLAMLAAMAIGMLWYLSDKTEIPWLWALMGIAGLGLLFSMIRLKLHWLLHHVSWLHQLAQWILLAWLSPDVRYRQLALTMAILGCNLLAFYACARAVSVDLSGSHALLVLPATLLIMALPVSVAGWGVREAAAALLWPLAQVSSESAIAASIAYGLIATASALPGVLFLWRPLATWTQQRHRKGHEFPRN